MGIYSYGYKAGKKLLQKFLKPQKTTGTEVIKSVAPKFPKNKIQAAVRDVQKTAFATRGSMKRQSQAFDRDLQKVKSSIGQSMQKLKGEPVTASGVSKGKDLVKKAKGGRVGLKRGTPKRQTNIQKIKKTFSTNNKLGMQSVIYGLDKNPNITKADPKAKFIAAANKKKKKKVI
jgi:hypothetical protein